jgi:hypothetical protein
LALQLIGGKVDHVAGCAALLRDRGNAMRAWEWGLMKRIPMFLLPPLRVMPNRLGNTRLTIAFSDVDTDDELAFTPALNSLGT